MLLISEKVRGYIEDGDRRYIFHEKYFSKLVKRTRETYKKDFMFLFAWNEWGEGGYLEPDEENQYGYLEAVRSALIENGEFPD